MADQRTILTQGMKWVCDCGRKNPMSMTQAQCGCKRIDMIVKLKASMEASCVCECGEEKTAGRDMCRKCNPEEYRDSINYKKTN